MEKTTAVNEPGSIGQLMHFDIPALQDVHRELLGKDCSVLHVLYLRRKLAWELQARSQGGLPARRWQPNQIHPLPNLYDDGGYTGTNLDRPVSKLPLDRIVPGDTTCEPK